MKIIERGNPDAANKALRGRCRLCGCLIECDRFEARWVDLGSGDGCYSVECPCCKDKSLILTWSQE